MSKPVREVEIETVEGATARLKAVLDTGSFHTLIHEKCLPKNSLILRYKEPHSYGTAHPAGRLSTIGKVGLNVSIEGHTIEIEAKVCPELSADMIIGAGAMQMWDITIQNDNGHTTIRVAHDMNDPDIQTVL